jgi:Fe-S-cluster-containing dehydrogenase component
MTSLPTKPPQKKLGLVIDLDTCVGCHACAVACKEWNTGGMPAPLSDLNPYGPEPVGAWLNRIHGYEGFDEDSCDRTVYFPRSCLHCDNAACVTVCPTGASYKRQTDGIVLVDEDRCMGCGLCAWACPYGAREMDPVDGVMKKCTLCVDRIDNLNMPQAEREPACVRACPAKARHFGDLNDPSSEVSRLVAERDGRAPMEELDYRPVNRYLPPRRSDRPTRSEIPAELPDAPAAGGFLGWVDRLLSD